MMGSVGFGEILIIAIVAFFVFGPDRLPELAKKAGETIAKARKAVGEFTDSFDRETGEGMAPLRDIGSELKGVRDDLAKAAGSMFDVTVSADSNADVRAQSDDSGDTTVNDGNDSVAIQEREQERKQKRKQEEKQRQKQGEKNEQKMLDATSPAQDDDPHDGEWSIDLTATGREKSSEQEPIPTGDTAETEGDSE